MNINRRSILMMSGVVATAFIIGALMPFGTIMNTNQMRDANTITGYVTISVMRDGQEIYHHEDHNQITEAGAAFFANQISGVPSTTEVARFIALSNTTTTSDDDDDALGGEITTAGLARVSATFTNNDGNSTDDNDDDYTLTHEFTATGTHTDVQSAGLFTDVTVGADAMVAINTFTPVTLNNQDTLTITWTIDFGPTGFDTA